MQVFLGNSGGGGGGGCGGGNQPNHNFGGQDFLVRVAIGVAIGALMLLVKLMLLVLLSNLHPDQISWNWCYWCFY